MKERPRRRTREETEQRMLDVALAKIRRDGILTGLNLADVADEAGVNRGLIYQYFGSRQQLLRAAIERSAWDRTESFVNRFRDLPFAQRRLAIFRDALHVNERFKLLALLVMDHDRSARIFPNLPEVISWMRRDVETDALPKEADSLVAHALTGALYLGYGIFREQMARELDMSLDELDQRAERVAAHMIYGIVTQAAEGQSDPQIEIDHAHKSPRDCAVDD